MDQATWPYENLLYENFENLDLYAWPCDHTFLNSQPPGSSQIPHSVTISSSTGVFEQLEPIPRGDFEMRSENNLTSHQISFDLIESIQHRSTGAETSDGLTDTVPTQESSLNPVQSIEQERPRRKRKRNSPSANIPSPIQASERIYRCQRPGCNAPGFNRRGLLQ